MLENGKKRRQPKTVLSPRANGAATLIYKTTILPFVFMHCERSMGSFELSSIDRNTLQRIHDTRTFYERDVAVNVTIDTSLDCVEVGVACNTARSKPLCRQGGFQRKGKQVMRSRLNLYQIPETGHVIHIVSALVERFGGRQLNPG